MFILTAGRISTGVAFDIRQAAFEKLQQLSFSYYDRKAVGWLMARVTGDCSALRACMGWALLDFAWGTSVLIARDGHDVPAELETGAVHGVSGPAAVVGRAVLSGAAAADQPGAAEGQFADDGGI